MGRELAKRKLLPAMTAAWLLLSAIAGLAADVKLQWDANTEPALAGYRVHVGSATRNYSTSLNAGNVTSYTLTGLAAGTYYIAVTAYDSYQQTSDYSNEVTATVPPLAPNCDVNGDNVLNALDIQAMVNFILGSSANPGNYDTNRDGTVNALDLQTIGNIILGIWTCR
jgi:hypothetical protein